MVNMGFRKGFGCWHNLWVDAGWLTAILDMTSLNASVREMVMLRVALRAGTFTQVEHSTDLDWQCLCFYQLSCKRRQWNKDILQDCRLCAGYSSAGLHRCFDSLTSKSMHC